MQLCGCADTVLALLAWLSAGRNMFLVNKEGTMSIYMILFFLLLLAWVGGFTMFHVAGALIHILLVFAVISLVLHFVMGRRTA
jgi:hypothetical protein